MPPKKGFGEKLKGVGKAIGRGVKKVPGTIYRDVIKPYGQHMADKFTEEGPGAERLVGPIKQGTPEQRARARKALLPAKILSPAEQVSKPIKPIKEQLKGKYYPLAGGRTSAYDTPVRMIPRPGETMDTPAFKARRQKAQDEQDQRKSLPKDKAPPFEGRPLLRRGTQQEKAIRDATKTTTAEPLTDQTRATVGRTKAKARGSISRYRIKTKAAVPEQSKTEPALAKTPKDKPPTSRDIAFTAKRRQKAGVQASRKGKAGKRKFSPKRTAETLNKAAAATSKPIERIDTSAQDMARILIEQEVGREAERANVALQGGRKPTREKARYRLRTRGYKRSEGRSR